MTNFCTNCDRKYPDSTIICEECKGELKHVEDTKENRVILAKIETKNIEFENNKGWGPILLIIVGLIFTIVLIGVPCIIVGVWWDFKREANRKKINAEIDELETELGVRG